MKALLIVFFSLLISACQTITPIFVDYNGVRRDVAQWINGHTLLSMQQKRSLVQLSKAQQKLVHIDKIIEANKLTIATENQIAMYCAKQHLSVKKITQLQSHVFAVVNKDEIIKQYDQQFPKIKLDVSQIKCE